MTEKKNAGYEWSTPLQNQVVPLVNRLQSFPKPLPPIHFSFSPENGL